MSIFAKKPNAKNLTIFSEASCYHGLYLLLAVFAVYVWGIYSPFIFDDTYNILQNAYIKDLGHFLQYFTDPRTHNALPENSPYRPLCTAVYAILWWLGDGSTVPFRLYKILLHVGVAWIGFKSVCQIAGVKNQENTTERKWLVAAAWAGALLFALHPANSETVSYISSTSTLQCSFFYIAAFYAYLNGRLFAMATLFFASVLTKEEGASFPAVIFLHGLIFQNGKVNFRAFFSAVGTLALYLVIYVNMPKTVEFSQIDNVTYLFTQFRAWLKYWIWIFVPTGFSIEHQDFGFSENFFDPKVVGSLIANLVIIGTALGLLFRRFRSLSIELRILIFGVLWFYVALSPSSSIFALAEPVNEHRYYLSYAMVFPAIAVALTLLRDRLPKHALQIAAVIAALSLAAISLREVHIWKSADRVWQNTIEKDPTNPRAFLNLGVLQLGRAEYDAAIANFNKCKELKPMYQFCSLNLGIAYAALNDLEKAEAEYLYTLKLDPNFVLGLGHYGTFLVKQKRSYAEGLRYLKDCETKSQGALQHCLGAQAEAYRNLGQFAESEQAARRVLARAPESRDLQFELGLSLITNKKFDEAYDVYFEIRKRYPSDVQAIHNLAWVEMERKRWVEAKNLWFEKLKLVPGDRASWLHLKIVAEALGDKDLAAEVTRNLAP